MIFAASDIHGNYKKYKKLIEKIPPSDTLYILGDVVDRGRDGLKILCDMSARPNVVGLMGNHECLALLCLPMLVKMLNERSSDCLGEDELRTFAEWVSDGGSYTVSEFTELSASERQTAFAYMNKMLPYAEVGAGGNDFVLVHAGLGNFSPEKKLREYSAEELMFSRPNPNRTYFEDKYLVFGHTPVSVLRKKSPDGNPDNNAIYEKGRLIGIDCGCGHGGKLGCICLDTMEKFYFLRKEPEWKS